MPPEMGLHIVWGFRCPRSDLTRAVFGVFSVSVVHVEGGEDGVGVWGELIGGGVFVPVDVDCDLEQWFECCDDLFDAHPGVVLEVA